MALLSAKRAFLASLWPLSIRCHIVARRRRCRRALRRTATTPPICPSEIKTHCYLFLFLTPYDAPKTIIIELYFLSLRTGVIKPWKRHNPIFQKVLRN